MLKNNIYLIGPMGVGKTTIGKILAKKLNLIFKDSDNEIEQTSGVDLAWIFDIEKEEGFKQREKKAIDKLCQLEGIVLATGGGSVDEEANRTQLTKNGFVVYLQAPVEIQIERVKNDTKRPVLQVGDKVATVKALFEKREPWYQQISHMQIETIKYSSLKKLTDEIANQYINYQKNNNFKSE